MTSLKTFPSHSFNENSESLTKSPLIYLILLLLIFLISAYYFITQPIYSFSDTDLWYHLNGGRYFIETNRIPHTGFFSFIAESRQWSNYYWLFQVLVYQIYSIADYYGLIILKTALFLLTILSISFFLFNNEESNDKRTLYLFITLILICIGIVPRYYAVFRPHMFSYLLIPVTLILIEYRSRALILLPIIILFWANVHGIEYPVIICICGSYLVEYFVLRIFKKETLNKQTLFFLILVVFSMWALLANPFGWTILETPFNRAAHQDFFIEELQKLNITEFFSLKLYPINDLTWTSLNCLIIWTCIGSIKAIYRKKLRISHLLMLIGGIVLLTQAKRFRYEAVLLALPILKYHPLISFQHSSRSFHFLSRLLAVTFFIVILLFCFNDLFRPKGRYPFSYTHLPRGVVTFLNHVNTGGRILNPQNWGGYLQWTLNPKYKIAMDLQMVLFSDKDYFLVMNALNTKDGFATFSAKYSPDYIIGQREDTPLRTIIKAFPEYVMVFFDNASVLYVNKNKYPEIALQYNLEMIDPYHLVGQDIESLSFEMSEVMIKELQCIRNIYPDGMLINFQIGRILKKNGKIQNALILADIIIENYPEHPFGYVLKADLLLDQKQYSDAIPLYSKALKCSLKTDSAMIFKRISITYSKIGNDEKAYQYMKKSVNLFSPYTDYNELWQMGNMALKAGKINEAIEILDFALIKVPTIKKRDRDLIRAQIEGLNNSRRNAFTDK